MKDNQMKQAELLPCPFCGGDAMPYYENAGCVNTKCAIGNMSFKWDEWQARAKLTTSQVSEPVGELSIDHHGFGSYRHLKELPIGYHKLYTTPQEAISPAIEESSDDILIKAMQDGYKIGFSEPWDALTDEANEKFKWYVERTKAPFCDSTGLRLWHGKTVFEAIEKARSSLASKPTGLE